MKTYRVQWTIDLEANCPEDAASLALEMQRDPTSTATVFEVRERFNFGYNYGALDVIDADPAALERSES